MLNAVGQYSDSSIEVLREAVDLSHPAAVRAVAGLVDAGLVEKKSGTDKRSVALALTASGKRKAKRLQTARERHADVATGDHERRARCLYARLTRRPASTRSIVVNGLTPQVRRLRFKPIEQACLERFAFNQPRVHESARIVEARAYPINIRIRFFAIEVLYIFGR
ncbi:MarR family transcriptional regulator [Paraburkholderia phytofirmans]|uniref:MarR family transcriptional regulator n=1 Tax=Paraburkholderia phytofirmans TaxID=261302 RepID=UPI001EEE870A|nr:MarR family transcriptional regulator [Paraburkholderia phytofirmans]